MKKYFLLLVLVILFISVNADYFVPIEDPVYDFLSMMQELKYLPQSADIYPGYHAEIMGNLQQLKKKELAASYQKLLEYHLQRLENEPEKGTELAFYPLSNLKNTIWEVWQPHSEKKHLATYKKGEAKFFYSGLLGIEYDVKRSGSSELYRKREYYGMDFGGNFYDNFGFRVSFKKGHFNGDNSFIEENPDLSIMGNSFFKDDDTYYEVNLNSQLDYKNKYLNLSFGYDTFRLGNAVRSSIILNSGVTPYGYLKYYKKIGNFSYLGLTTQLIPDSLRNETDYKPKSMAIQSLSYANNFISLTIGNTMIYGDRTLDLAYSSPLALYKIMDNKYHGRDNTSAFAFGKLVPVKGISLYGNLFLDDLEKERLKTKYWATSLAFQGGVDYSCKIFPVAASLEVTGVGPGVYTHKSDNSGYSNLRYSQDERLLGYEYGSNLLTLAGQVNYFNRYFKLNFLYENIQQGNLANDPFGEYEKVEFLADSISRKQLLTSKFVLNYIPELHLSLEYKKDLLLTENYYIFSNIEVKF